MSADELSPKIKKLIKEKGWKGLNELQIKSLEPIKNGDNVIITAPTGFGKTESGLIPVLDMMVKDNPEPVALLYITPMKALINDIVKRISWWTEKLGFIVARKHGDVPQAEKVMRLRKKPHILVSTPESLKIDLDWSSKFRTNYRNLRWIIVDEIHEIIGNKRGVQLAILLERLRSSFGIDPQIIALSATIGSPRRALEILSGSSKRKKTVISLANANKEFWIKISYVDGTPEIDRLTRLARKIIEEIEPLSIIFVPSRHSAERLQEELEKLGYKEVMVHHSSISGKIKEHVEDLMRKGKVKAVISTRTLELGIDVGDIKKIIIVGSPNTAYSLLQKVGRSGHSEEEVSKGTVITTSRLEVLEAYSTAINALKGLIEPQEPIDCPLDVISREIVGMALSGHPLKLSDVHQVITNSKICRSFTLEDTETITNYLVEKRLLSWKNNHLSIGPLFFKIWKFNKNDRKWWSREFSEFFTLISDSDSFQVRNNGTIIGELDSTFVYRHLRVGDNIRLSGSTWKIIDIDDNSGKIEVIRTETSTNEVPLWRGGGSSTSIEVLNTLRYLLSHKQIIERMEKNVILDENAQRVISAFFKKDTNEKLPFIENKIILYEGENEIIMFTGLGQRINEAIALLLLMELTSKVSLNSSVKISPYGIAASPKIDVIGLLSRFDNKKQLEESIEEAIKRSPALQEKIKEIQYSLGVIGKPDEEDALLVSEAIRQIKLSLDIEGLWNIIEKLKTAELHILTKKLEEIPTFLVEELRTRPYTKPWIRDSTIAITNTLKGYAFTEEELSEILMLPHKTISNKLKELRKPNNKTRVFRFIDVDTSEWRWALVEEWKELIDNEEFKESFTPLDPSQPFLLQVRTTEKSQYVSFITSVKEIFSNPDSILSKIPSDELYELKILPIAQGFLRNFSPRYYFIPKELIPILFANGVTALQRLEGIE